MSGISRATGPTKDKPWWSIYQPEETLMGEFKQYRRTNIAEMRPYVPGESLEGISVSDQDDPPNDLGMVARNPNNHKDQWYVARQYFEDNFEPLD